MRRYAVACCSTNDGDSMVIEFHHATSELNAAMKHSMVNGLIEDEAYATMDDFREDMFSQNDFIIDAVVTEAV